jgi:hypothetical protein
MNDLVKKLIDYLITKRTVQLFSENFNLTLMSKNLTTLPGFMIMTKGHQKTIKGTFLSKEDRQLQRHCYPCPHQILKAIS